MTPVIGQTHYRVLYGDVDSMGVVYYGQYLRLFERGRAEFIRDLGMSYRQVEEFGFLLPVTETLCHYFESAEYDDCLLIETKVDQIKRASIRFRYTIFRDDDKTEKLAEGYTHHACVTPEKKVVRLPDFFLEMICTGGVES